MLDSQKYAGSSANSASLDALGASSSLNEPEPQAFTPEECLVVTGAVWAEYHLLLGESSPHSTRIQREIRTFGGAPTIAVLLARWSIENPQTAPTVIALELTLGHDPNARLMRRELEKWQEQLPNLRVCIQDEATAPDVEYRILLWPQGSASTWGEPQVQVLEHGDIGRHYEIRNRGSVGSFETSDAVVAAAATWAEIALHHSLHQKTQLFQAALRRWNQKPALERIACALSWAEVEREAGAQAGFGERAEGR